jgi:hypothetical protein
MSDPVILVAIVVPGMVLATLGVVAIVHHTKFTAKAGTQGAEFKTTLSPERGTPKPPRRKRS